MQAGSSTVPTAGTTRTQKQMGRVDVFCVTGFFGVWSRYSLVFGGNLTLDPSP